MDQNGWLLVFLLIVVLYVSQNRREQFPKTSSKSNPNHQLKGKINASPSPSPSPPHHQLKKSFGIGCTSDNECESDNCITPDNRKCKNGWVLGECTCSFPSTWL